MKEKIRKYFKEHDDLPTANVINRIGIWAKGECYAVTCGWIKLKKYCVYCIDDEIYDVKLRK